MFIGLEYRSRPAPRAPRPCAIRPPPPPLPKHAQKSYSSQRRTPTRGVWAESKKTITRLRFEDAPRRRRRHGATGARAASAATARCTASGRGAGPARSAHAPPPPQRASRAVSRGRDSVATRKKLNQFHG